MGFQSIDTNPRVDVFERLDQIQQLEDDSRDIADETNHGDYDGKGSYQYHWIHDDTLKLQWSSETVLCSTIPQCFD